jgi:hypothetical protein
LTSLDDNRIDCKRHGPSEPPTFACVHIVTETGRGVRFASDAQSEPWPDVTCDACDAEPEWTDEEAVERLRLVCKFCWEECVARNGRVEARTDEEVADLIERARHRAAERQDAWCDRFGVGTHAHWQMNLDGPEPWLGFGESATRIHVRADALVIGSWGSRTGTWFWGWANAIWEPHLTRAFVPVKRWAEAEGLTPLWRAMSDASEEDGFAYAATAFDRLPQIEGIYRAPTEKGALFLAARNTRFMT